MLNLRVASVQIEEFEWVCLLALLFDESFSVEDFIKLSIELVSVALKLVSLSPDMLVDIIKCSLKDLVDLLCHGSGIVFYVVHLKHDLLKSFLDYIFLFCQCDVFGGSLSTSICMSVLDPQDSLFGRPTDLAVLLSASVQL